MKLANNLKYLLSNNSYISTKTFNKNYKMFSTSVVNYTREDLTKLWILRVQDKANDSAAQESVSNLSSLIDYYMKKAEDSSTNKLLDIDWDSWKKEIRTPDVVDSLKNKLEEAKTQSYNVEGLASKAAITNDKFDHVGLYLKYNHDLYMRHYTETLEGLYSTLSLGDMSYVPINELVEYEKGAANHHNGWTETGYMLNRKLLYTINLI